MAPHLRHNEKKPIRDLGARSLVAKKGKFVSFYLVLTLRTTCKLHDVPGFRMIPLLITCLVIPLAAGVARRPPNIIFILADDVGWADTSLVGSHQIPTPNIDALAANGVLLDQYYTLPLCTPSRAALMTGFYPTRLGLQHHVLIPGEKGGLPLGIATMAERLRGLGYRTHALGKWNLGYSRAEYTPIRRGFQTFFGSYNVARNYFSPLLNFEGKCGLDLWDNDKPVLSTAGLYDTHMLTDRAIDIISRHDTDEPMFMYLSPLAAHAETEERPTAAPKRNVAKFPHIRDRRRRLLAGTMDALDESVGRIIHALYKRGMLSNSVVVFTSDNGAIPRGIYSNAGSNWPLRGVKGTLWEGGIRVPALVWSPLLRPELVQQPMHVVDWLPTLYSAAGGCVSDLGAIDGVDLWPALTAPGHTSAKYWPRKEFLVNVDLQSGISAYRDGPYKLVAITEPAGLTSRTPFRKPDQQGHVPIPGGTPRLSAEESDAVDVYLDSLMRSSLTWRTLRNFYWGYVRYHFQWRQHARVWCGSANASSVSGLRQLRQGYYLFNLSTDPCELHSLASQLPEVVARLARKLEWYAVTSVPAKKHVLDPRGLPRSNDCLWARWEDEEQSADRTCACA